MAGYVSLNSSVRTCKIDPAYASKIQSDRFLNPNNAVCPAWNGYDAAGRPACANSFMTKSAGCNTAEDRVGVENSQRPQYLEYINLSSNGIQGNIYGDPSYAGQGYGVQMCDEGQGGNFGIQLDSVRYPGCGTYNYIRGMQQNQEDLRKYSAYLNGLQSNTFKTMSGFY